MIKLYRILVTPIYIALLLGTLLFAIPFIFVDRDVYDGRFGNGFMRGVNGE